MSATPELSFSLYQALLRLQAEYAAAVDQGRWAEWPTFFLSQGVYRLQPRENHERGFPLATLAFDSRAMMEDRVYGITETLFHDPYYQRHVLSPPLVHEVSPLEALEALEALEVPDTSEGSGVRIRCETHYAVFRTKLSAETTVFNVGRYLDTVVSTPQGLKFAERLVVYDSEMIPNSLIYPI